MYYMSAINSHTEKGEQGGRIRINKETINKVIFPEYNVRLVFYANRFLNDEEKARDAVHNTFMALWEKKANAEFEDKRQLKNYLYSVTRNKAIDLVRESRRENVELDLFKRYTDHSTTHSEVKDNAMVLAEAVAFLKKAVSELSPQCRAVMELLIEGETMEEISERLNMSRVAVRQNKYQGIIALQKRFSGHVLLAFVLLLFDVCETKILN